MAVLAVQFTFVFSAVCGVQHLGAHSAFEALLVEFVATSHTFFGGVDGLAAFWALGVFYWLEWHFDLIFLVDSIEFN